MIDPVIGGALIDLGGNLLGNLFGSHNQRSANRTNIKLQREAQAYNTQMSNTAVQRRKADIIAAGGNPALAFTNGQEASSQTIGPATVSPFKPDIKSNFTAAALMKAQVQNLATASGKNQADTALALAQADLTKTNKAAIEATTGRTGAETDKINQDIENLKAAKANLVQQLENLTTEGELAKIKLQIAKATVPETIQLVKNHAQETTTSAKKAGLIEEAIDGFKATTQGIATWVVDQYMKGEEQQEAFLKKFKGAPRNTGKATGQKRKGR